MLASEKYQVGSRVGYARYSKWHGKMQESGFGIVKKISKKGHLVIDIGGGATIEFDNLGNQRKATFGYTLLDVESLQKELDKQKKNAQFIVQATKMQKFLQTCIDNVNQGLVFNAVQKDELLALFNTLEV